MSNTDGFFTGLKTYDDKKRGCKKLRMSKSERKQYEITQLQARKAQMDSKLNRMQTELEEIRNVEAVESSSSSDSDDNGSINPVPPQPARNSNISNS